MRACASVSTSSALTSNGTAGQDLHPLGFVAVEEPQHVVPIGGRGGRVVGVVAVEQVLASLSADCGRVLGGQRAVRRTVEGEQFLAVLWNDDESRVHRPGLFGDGDDEVAHLLAVVESGLLIVGNERRDHDTDGGGGGVCATAEHAEAEKVNQARQPAAGGVADGHREGVDDSGGRDRCHRDVGPRAIGRDLRGPVGRLGLHRESQMLAVGVDRVQLTGDHAVGALPGLARSQAWSLVVEQRRQPREEPRPPAGTRIGGGLGRPGRKGSSGGGRGGRRGGQHRGQHS